MMLIFMQKNFVERSCYQIRGMETCRLGCGKAVKFGQIMEFEEEAFSGIASVAAIVVNQDC